MTTSGPLSGETSSGIRWQLKEGASSRHILISSAIKKKKISLSLRESKALFTRHDAFESLMEVMGPAVLEDGVNVPLARLLKLPSLRPSHFKSLELAPDNWTKLAMILIYCERTREAPASVLRLAKILKTVDGAKYTLRSHELITHISVQKISLERWLDTLNFFINAKPDQTFKEFHALNAGSVFYLQTSTKETRTGYSTSRDLRYRKYEPAISRNTVKLLMHRFLQLARRSRKLERKLYSMPLEKLVQALDFAIPGTLLVTDTIELLDSLKHIPLREEGSQRFNVELQSLLGKPLGNKIAKLQLTEEVRRFVRDQYGTDTPVFIRDTQGLGNNLPFVAHGMRKLGVEETVQLMRTIDFETEGVTMRGWMELVRRGGFTGPEPPGWTTVLLP